jgi:putative FmdB family regulatory protein
MPIYEYRCENGHTFEAMQRMTDDPLTHCTECGAPVQRVFHPVAVHFKGSGFYSTDYGRQKSGPSSDSKDSKDSKDSSSSSSDSSDSSKKESKAKSKSDGGSSSGSSAD